MVIRKKERGKKKKVENKENKNKGKILARLNKGCKEKARRRKIENRGLGTKK